jgi:hypothetical protein
MYCHKIKMGDLFVLNTYKGKLCIKMIGFSREIDGHHRNWQFIFKIYKNNENDMAAHAVWAVFRLRV